MRSAILATLVAVAIWGWALWVAPIPRHPIAYRASPYGLVQAARGAIGSVGEPEAARVADHFLRAAIAADRGSLEELGKPHSIQQVIALAHELPRFLEGPIQHTRVEAVLEWGGEVFIDLRAFSAVRHLGLSIQLTGSGHGWVVEAIYPVGTCEFGLGRTT